MKRRGKKKRTKWRSSLSERLDSARGVLSTPLITLFRRTRAGCHRLWCVFRGIYLFFRNMEGNSKFTEDLRRDYEANEEIRSCACSAGYRSLGSSRRKRVCKRCNKLELRHHSRCIKITAKTTAATKCASPAWENYEVYAGSTDEHPATYQWRGTTENY